MEDELEDIKKEKQKKEKQKNRNIKIKKLNKLLLQKRPYNNNKL